MMTPTGLRLSLLAALTTSCSWQTKAPDVAPIAPDSDVPEEGAPVSEPASTGTFSVAHAPAFHGRVGATIPADKLDTDMVLVASDRRGSTVVRGVRTELHRPTVVAIHDLGHSGDLLIGLHETWVEVGSEIHLQMVALDGSWRSEVVSSVMQPIREPVCGEGTLATQVVPAAGANVTVCNRNFVPQMCPESWEVQGPAVLTQAGVTLDGLTTGPVCHEASAEAACCYTMPLVEVGIDTGWGWVGDSGDVGGGGGGWAGRPFRVAGEVRTAPLSGGLDASDNAPAIEAWKRGAVAEHGSIPAFARFTMELIQFGAPLDLIEAASAAQLDEVRHAAACVRMVKHLGGGDVVLGAIPMDAALTGRDLRTVVLDVVREGCIEETVSAVIAMRARDGAADPVAREVLAGIADDESRHAELGWRFVKWALEQPGTEGLAAEVDALLRAFSPDVTTPESEEAEQLARLGVLSRHRRERAAVEALAIIESCRLALNGSA